MAIILLEWTISVSITRPPYALKAHDFVNQTILLKANVVASLSDDLVHICKADWEKSSRAGARVSILFAEGKAVLGRALDSVYDGLLLPLW